ncbi:MAG TPA: efflux RND transporter permease subunit [Planctomycetota bacterium]|nr:efflux RND transporter permease subunit [Planctomycetota bacterium]
MSIEGLVRGASRRPTLTILLALLGAALGGAWLAALPRDVFPDLSAPVFNVIVQNPALSAEELETGVVIPLEAACGGLAGVRRVRSTSQPGVAQLTLEFEADADWFRCRQLVAERLTAVADQLPAGTGAPLLSSLTGRLNEIIEVTLDADPGAADLMTLRDLADFEVRNRLLAVPGVAAVERLGGYLRQVQIQPDPGRMVARGVTLEDVLHAARAASQDASCGVLADGSIEWSVRALARAHDLTDLREVVVAVRDGVPARLGDVADIVEAPATRRGLAHHMEGEIVSCRVVKQFGADTVRVAAGVEAAVDELRRALPAGVRLDIVYDQADLVRESLGGVERAILLGAGLVVLVLVLLLGDLRAALLVTLTLPVALLLSGVFLKPLGAGLNAMTLGGLAIAVGLMADAAIIVVENVVHRLARACAGSPAARRAEAVAASVEVARPIVFATLIVIAVFLPLFAMTGLEGRMYRPLAAAVVAAVSAALLLALTLVPLAAGLVLRPRRAGAPDDVALVRAVKRGYAPLLDACLRHGALVRAAALLLTLPALWLATRVGADFMPQLDEGAFLVQTLLPAEASLDEVDRLNHGVEDALRGVPEVADVVRRTGRSESTEDPMPHVLSDVLVLLRPDRARGREELEAALRDALDGVPGVSSLVTTPLGMRIDEGLGGTPADISVRLFGPDLQQLGELSGRAREILERVPGLVDLRVEPLDELPQLRLEVDRQAAARAGLAPGEIVEALRVALAGEEVGTIWRGERRHDLVVRLAEPERRDPAALAALRLDAHDGTPIPLAQLARIEAGSGPAAIRREAGSRRVAIEASVEGRDLSSVAADVRAALAAELPLPPGCFVALGGRVESQEESSRALLLAIAAAVVAVFVLLDLALGSAAESLVILATLPDAFVGGILALWLAGETWNVSSLVGLIGLLGIAVQNGLVLVTQTRALVAEGRPFEAALREACLGRVRPKLMTAATAILGLLPLLVLRLPGTELERPLAVVMTGGLITSTLFTLLALPSFYALVQRWRERRRA